ncbi:MAG: acyloxyacyl hydrolase [Acidobacteriota bacterium]|nr:acyloxyacyl hydrolase [Acidobacteriota bacterium]
MVRYVIRCVAILLVCTSALAGTKPQEFNLYLGNASSETNRHGRSRFRTISFELLANSRLVERYVERWLPNARAGVDIDYADVRQPRSWFGHTYGDPDDSVRAEWAHFFIRQYWRMSSNELRPYVDLGTGPMWSNRRIPAATSKLNFNSQLGLGVVVFPNARTPVYVGYRFFHISNGGFTGRNPGLNVNGFFAGTNLRRW